MNNLTSNNQGRSDNSDLPLESPNNIWRIQGNKMAAIPTIANQKVGVKGSDCYETTNDPRVDLSVQLVRGLSEDKIRVYAEAILGKADLARTPEEQQWLLDYCVLIFQTRNIRGGKGERELAYLLFLQLYEQGHMSLAEMLLPLFGDYGYWRDLVILAGRGPEAYTNPPKAAEVIIEQLRKDEALLDTEGSLAKISLVAKWAPREKSQHTKLAKKVAQRMFFGKPVQEALKSYRQLLARLNRHLDTVEIKLCAQKTAEIVPDKVPGRAVALYRKALLNEPLEARRRRGSDSGVVRRPDDKDRIECAEHFRTYFQQVASGEKKAKGSDTVYPHEIVAKVLDYVEMSERSRDMCCLPYRDEEAGTLMSEDEQNLLRGQWRAHVDAVRSGDSPLKRAWAMCDFSGSMDGIPKLVSVALGILLSEINGTHEILTFDSTPQWHRFPHGPTDDIFTQVASIGGRLGVGLSTDFQKALDLVLARIKRDRLTKEQIPTELFVFTDMGFDQACASNQTSLYTGNSYRHVVKTEEWQTQLEMAREAFRRAGEDMFGPEGAFEPPRIVIWNLRAEYADFHAQADTEGVCMLSGWSPALFKVLMNEGVKIATPWDTLRAQLDDPMYDKVRDIVRRYLAEL